MLVAAAAPLLVTALAAAGPQKLASHRAVSSNDAVISTPKGTRPRALHASTCGRSSENHRAALEGHEGARAVVDRATDQ